MSARYITQFARRSGAARLDPPAGEGAGASTPAIPPAPVPVDAPAAPVSAPPATEPTPAPVLRSSRSRRASTVALAGPSRVKPSPSAPSTGEVSLNSGLAYKLLVGGPKGSAGVDSASTALFWRNELSRAEGAALAANDHVDFVCGKYLETIKHCLAELTEDDPRFKRVKFSGPSPLDKGKGKSVPRNKGKGCAKAVDEDDHEDASGDSE